jgi:RHS repeat-associated protein
MWSACQGRSIAAPAGEEDSCGTTNYLYDGANSLEEMDNTGAILARYSQASRIDEPLSEHRSGTTSYYQADGLGSITSLSNGSGALTNTYSYDSFGDLIASTGTITNPFRYTGREFDSETGLNYLRARYLDPNAGRFLAEDPIGFGGGANFYGYVQNNPLIFLDPMGLCVSILVEDRAYSLTGRSIEGLISVTSDKTPLNFWGYTLENANAGDNHNKPPIPEGNYDAFIRRDHDPNRVELTGLKGYHNVQIHNGNYPSDFKGCIGVGTSQKNDFIGGSKDALNQILSIIEADGTGCITVVVQAVQPPAEPLHCNGAKCGS